MRRAGFVAIMTCVAAACTAFSGSDQSGGDATTSADASGQGADASGAVDGNGASDANVGETSTAPAPDAGVDGGGPVGGYRVFASTEAFDTVPSVALVCQQLADDAGLGGQWVAWLGVNGSTSPVTRMGTGPWHRIDGNHTLVTSLSDLHAGNALAAPVLNDQHGVDVSASNSSYEMYTGLDNQGNVLAHTCADWSSALASFQGEIGLANDTDIHWTANGYVNCGAAARHIYCFEK